MLDAMAWVILGTTCAALLLGALGVVVVRRRRARAMFALSPRERSEIEGRAALRALRRESDRRLRRPGDDFSGGPDWSTSGGGFDGTP